MIKNVHGLTRQIAAAPIALAMLLFCPPGYSSDEGVDISLSPTIPGIEQISRRCFTKLREAGHDRGRVPAGEMDACMAPEIEAMAEFAYEVSTAYPVSSLTRIALETCTLEQANARASQVNGVAASDSKKLSWRWLTDCLKAVRWLDHDEQMERLNRARRSAGATGKQKAN